MHLSIKKLNLKYCVLSPKNESSFIQDLKSLKRGDDLLKGLSGYFPYTLLETFPSKQSESHAWKEIKQRYFMR